LLVNHFLEQMNKAKKKKIRGMEREVLKALEEYDWPGNVRELENVIERMVILTEGDYITIEDLPEKIAAGHRKTGISKTEFPEEGVSLSQAVNEYERQLIISALERTGWVKNRAAKLLKMNRTTLVEKIKKQGIERPRMAN